MKYDVAIIGGGIVGLSVAYNLSIERPDMRIVIIEKESEVAFHQTGRNSGVIHSGIYYQPGSAKAVNCKKGYNLLLEFCRRERIEHDICGKLIVATSPEEEPKLMDIYSRGQENGLKGLRLLDPAEFRNIEPHVEGIKAIFVPQAGIVNYKEVSLALKKILVDRQIEFRFSNEVKKIKESDNQLEIQTNQSRLSCSYLVNCAGLYSDKIARLHGIEHKAQIIPFRGEYYLLKEEKRNLVNNLVYPVPDPAFPFLGVHFTRRIGGEVDAGPNAVLAYKREGYRKQDVNAVEFLETIFFPGFLKVAYKYWKVGLYEMYRSYSKKAFVKALQKLVPEIGEEDLIPGTSGVRAQLCDEKGNLIDDFMILHKKRAVHVLNAPSPAATSSLQIGKSIGQKILNQV
ncbi:MAG: L-2-hydroxyglutarate oxidase [Flavobacteriaceae bacterium]